MASPQEEHIRQQRERLERLRSIQIGKQGAQQELANPKIIIAQAVKREYPTLPYEEVQKATRELVLAPRKATIKVGKEEVKVEDLQFKIAESIELLNSETNSSQEYFSWFEDCSEIIQHMNDGYVTDRDLNERNDWISYSYTREAEIMTCLALYQNSAFPEAKKKYEQLYNKLVKLRQIRNAIKETTGGNSDETRERIEHMLQMVDPRKAVLFMAAMQEFKKHEERWNMPRSTLRKLRMYRGNDDDIYGEYDYFYDAYEPDYDPEVIHQREQYSYDDKLKEEILFHWDDDERTAPVHSKAEAMWAKTSHAGHDTSETQDDIRSRIAMLSGRRPPYKDSGLGVREDRASSFDAGKFRSLSSVRQTQNG